MKHVDQVHLGDLTLRESAVISGTVTGSLIVETGPAIITGTIVDDLIILDGRVTLRGAVVGSVYNESGALDIYGRVNGVVGGPSANTVLHEGSLATLADSAGEPLDLDVLDLDMTDLEVPEPTASGFARIDGSSIDLTTDDHLVDDRPGADGPTPADTVEPATGSRRPLTVDPTPVRSGFIAGALAAVGISAMVALGSYLAIGDRDATPVSVLGDVEQPPIAPAILAAPTSAPPATTPPATTPATTTEPPADQWSPSPEFAIGSAARQLRELPVALALAAPVDFNADDYAQWSDADNDCRDRRTDELLAESNGPVGMSDDGCAVLTGAWSDPWSGAEITGAEEAAIDHIIPLTHAHAAGAWAWDTATKQRFANDLDPAALRVVSRQTLEAKGASAPPDWRPDQQASWCGYAIDWIRTKHRWGLAVSADERAALEQMLVTCGFADSTGPLRQTLSTPPAEASITPG